MNSISQFISYLHSIIYCLANHVDLSAIWELLHKQLGNWVTTAQAIASVILPVLRAIVPKLDENSCDYLSIIHNIYPQAIIECSGALDNVTQGY